MKKFVIILTCIATLFAFVACENGFSLKKATPSDVVEDYYKALQNGDFEKALGYTNLKDSTEIQQQAKKMQDLEMQFSDYEILNEKISEDDGNTAEVEVKFKIASAFNKNPEEKTNTHKLVKQDGQWKISVEE